MAQTKRSKKNKLRLPIPSGLNKRRAVRGLSLKADTVKTYCQFVADKCSFLGWTPSTLEGASGVGYETCWRHMSGQVIEPRLTTCVMILHALHTDVKCLDTTKY